MDSERLFATLQKRVHFIDMDEQACNKAIAGPRRSTTFWSGIVYSRLSLCKVFTGAVLELLDITIEHVCTSIAGLGICNLQREVATQLRLGRQETVPKSKGASRTKPLTQHIPLFYQTLKSGLHIYHSFFFLSSPNVLITSMSIPSMITSLLARNSSISSSRMLKIKVPQVPLTVSLSQECGSPRHLAHMVKSSINGVRVINIRFLYLMSKALREPWSPLPTILPCQLRSSSNLPHLCQLTQETWIFPSISNDSEHGKLGQVFEPWFAAAVAAGSDFERPKIDWYSP